MSSLNAILFVTKSRSLGPRIVFHYPPSLPPAAGFGADHPTWIDSPSSTNCADSEYHNDESHSILDIYDDDNFNCYSDFGNGHSTSKTGQGTEYVEQDRTKPELRKWNSQIFNHMDMTDEKTTIADCHRQNGNGSSWDTVLGFKTDMLEKMLTPSREYNKKRFELGVESIVFVGAPMFVKDDGTWKKRKRHVPENKQETEASGDGSRLKYTNISEEGKSAHHLEESKKSESEHHQLNEEFKPDHYSGSSPEALPYPISDAGSDTRSNSTSYDGKPDMTMFNIVFVLTPSASNYQRLVRDMYYHITRKFAKALKVEEARFQYVWEETKRIMNIKQRAIEERDSITATWRHIVDVSSLAKSITIMFDSISHDKIAHIHFNDASYTSFQVPQVHSTPYLPNVKKSEKPGLWLTTSNVMLEDDMAPMTQHAALLLLEDSESLIKDFGGDATENSTALTFCIRNLSPTKSLLKISKRHNIVARDMEYMASHLVYWRRARLIAPLSPRDTYIVSPNADLLALSDAMSIYTQRFPKLPSLPKMLSMLSGAPRPFRSFIPSPEHRGLYMEILAWLMRGGWITQLRTFAWVRVTPDIKAQISAEMQRTSQTKRAPEERRDCVGDKDPAIGNKFPDKQNSPLFTPYSIKPLTTSLRLPVRILGSDAERSDESERIFGPKAEATSQIHGTSSPLPGPYSRSASGLGTTAAFISPPYFDSPTPIALPEPKPPRATVSKMNHTSSPRVSAVTQEFTERNLSSSSSSSSNLFTSSIILSPLKASSLEARWLEKIGQSFENEKMVSSGKCSSYSQEHGSNSISGHDLKESWPMLLRHFDGKHAIEDIGVREGIKRKRVVLLFNALKERGWLVVTRHW